MLGRKPAWSSRSAPPRSRASRTRPPSGRPCSSTALLAHRLLCHGEPPARRGLAQVFTPGVVRLKRVDVALALVDPCQQIGRVRAQRSTLSSPPPSGCSASGDSDDRGALVVAEGGGRGGGAGQASEPAAVALGTDTGCGGRLTTGGRPRGSEAARHRRRRAAPGEQLAAPRSRARSASRRQSHRARGARHAWPCCTRDGSCRRCRESRWRLGAAGQRSSRSDVRTS